MKDDKRLLISKILMIGSLVFLVMGFTCLYVAQHPKILNQFIHSEEK